LELTIFSTLAGKGLNTNFTHVLNRISLKKQARKILVVKVDGNICVPGFWGFKF
jgi:hypothetical protein